ncbi:MAG TPA: histidine utilization repressor [Pseudolabrys sp.]|nr:histidine utilization repressor [Pseudolabrys sp.]
MSESRRTEKDDTPEALPRYGEIRRELETAIVSGEWPPGHRVPSEQELLKRYGCSRMTVNKALSALAAAGLIVRRRRSGSFVAAPDNEANVLQIRPVEEDVRRENKRYSLHIDRRVERKASRRDAIRLSVAAGTPVLALDCVHFADRRPFAFEERLINLASVPSARDEAFHDISPGHWLLNKVPWSEAEHHIRAVNASAVMAAALDIGVGDACLVVERRTLNAGQAVTHVILSYPGSRHELVARFNPAA